jgi:tetratricopeptide (TPR) repeat protein
VLLRTAAIQRWQSGPSGGLLVEEGEKVMSAEATTYAVSSAVLPVPDPLSEAGLLHDLAVRAYSRGDAAGGIHLAERALTLRRSGLGATHPDVARDLSVLGALYHLGGRYLDADESYWRALGIIQNCYGPDHLEVATICADLAVLSSDRGDHDIAETLGRRSLRILQAVLGPEDTEVGRIMLNLAAAIAGQDRLGEASAFADCARAILSDRLPDAHPYVLAARQAVSRLQLAAR